MLVRNYMKDWPDNARSLLHCMPSAASSPRKNFGSLTVKMEGMNDAMNQNWEEKNIEEKKIIIRTDFNSAALRFVEIWLHSLFCPGQT